MRRAQVIEHTKVLKVQQEISELNQLKITYDFVKELKILSLGYGKCPKGPDSTTRGSCEGTVFDLLQQTPVHVDYQNFPY